MSLHFLFLEDLSVGGFSKRLNPYKEANGRNFESDVSDHIVLR